MAALNLYSVLSESKRIINAHSRHFLALSVIFLLPLSFSLIVSPTLLHLFSPFHSTSRIHILLRLSIPQFPTHIHHHHHPSILPQFPPHIIHHHHHHHHPKSIDLTSVIFPIAFSLFLILASLFALSTITHSVLHGFFGRPVKLPSALLSILSSFLPLISTNLIFHLILLSPLLPLSLLFPLPSNPLHLYLSSLLLASLLALFLYLRISYSLASVIAVAESSYGLTPLRRSAALTAGMKPLAAANLLFFALLEGILLWSSSVLVTGSRGGGGGAWWKDWAVVLQIVLTSTTLMVLLLYNTAANTVVYMYCKAVRGELAVEIAEEFAREYVSLPFDDGKVPHVVSVVARV